LPPERQTLCHSLWLVAGSLASPRRCLLVWLNGVHIILPPVRLPSALPACLRARAAAKLARPPSPAARSLACLPPGQPPTSVLGRGLSLAGLRLIVAASCRRRTGRRLLHKSCCRAPAALHRRSFYCARSFGLRRPAGSPSELGLAPQPSPSLGCPRP